jgi:hypothetical protein
MPELIEVAKTVAMLADEAEHGSTPDRRERAFYLLVDAAEHLAQVARQAS